MSAERSSQAERQFLVGEPNHAFDASKFERVTSLLKDCREVYVTRIGDVPAAELRKRGIEPVIYRGPIDKIAN